MSFNPANFTAPKAKPLPVILLLDKSGSMGGEPIQLLNQAVFFLRITISAPMAPMPKRA